MAKPVTGDDLSKQIKALERQLFNAKAHFEIFMGLAQAWEKHVREIENSPVFWQFTMKAQIDAAVAHLCRVYDHHPRGLHLPSFLAAVEKNTPLFCESEFKKRHATNPAVDYLAQQGRTLNLKQLEDDKRFCGDDNGLIINLRRWRNNLVAHFNYKEAVVQTVPMHQRTPFLYEHMKMLIDGGLDILNRYSALLDAKTYSTQFASQQGTDYSYVLNSLRFARIVRRWNQRRAINMIKRRFVGGKNV